MIILGDEFIPYEPIESIKTIDDIKNTKSNSTLCFEYDKKLMSYCAQNEIQYAVNISSLKESIYANALKAKYILPVSSILGDTQKCAENYLFDSKILAIVESEDEIEQYALKNIDGVVFKKLLL
ncbi:MAG: hypothetical protein U9Q04_08280 [Campylobacterota bacterium]|nr:hypothetical protein [Campylobacterota bacterium]